MKRFNVKEAPNALQSRSILEGLSPVSESRPGRTSFIMLFLALGPVMTLVAVLVFGALNPHPIFISLIFIWFPLSFYLMLREQVLVLQNYVPGLAEYVSPYLNDGEKVLTGFSGRMASLNIPDWLPDDFYQFSYFVFTSDRLLILIFSKDKVGIGKVTPYIENGMLDDIVLDIKSCDYLDDKTFAVGGFMANVLAMMSYSKIVVKPVGESEKYTWAIANKSTRNGHLLKEIVSRLVSRGSQSF